MTQSDEQRDAGVAVVERFADFKPLEVDGPTQAFGAMGHKLKALAPMYVDYHKNDCPREFQRHEGTFWNVVASQWFFGGVKVGCFVAKDGIDHDKAIRHVAAIMGSFEPDHQSKESICAYLMSLWFDDYQTPADATERTREQLDRRRASR